MWRCEVFRSVLEISRSNVWRLNSEGVREFEPRVSILGNKRRARETLKALANRFAILANAFSVCRPSLLVLSQGVATLRPGLALANAFGVRLGQRRFRVSGLRFGFRFRFRFLGFGLVLTARFG